MLFLSQRIQLHNMHDVSCDLREQAQLATNDSEYMLVSRVARERRSTVDNMVE